MRKICFVCDCMDMHIHIFLSWSMDVNTGAVIERMLSRIERNALSLLSLPGEGILWLL